ncbi:hypothetical protein CAT57_01370 [Acinetobacter pittii]|nr:hypothetical protein CAT57_01370 [Acinetobacter pittii]
MDNVIDANKDIKKQATELLKKAHAKVSNVPPVIPVKLTTYTHSLTILANSNMRCDSFKSHMIINKLSKFL